MRDPALGKWPRLIVAGGKVSPELAAEILIRTDRFYLSCNDRVWTRELYGALGIELDEHGLVENMDQEDEAKEHYGVLQLEYLVNQQIASSYVGGPHGWIDWDGTIGCNSFNIGKWPDSDEVLREWQLIASTWPELEFQSQLIADEGLGAPAVDYFIRGGEVRMAEPTGVLDGSATGVPPGNENFDVAMMRVFTQGSSRERGCTLDQFKAALALVEAKLGA